MSDFAQDIRDQVEAERQRSRYRDHFSRERKHPISNDLIKILDFVSSRRLGRDPLSATRRARLNACRSVLDSVDVNAMRVLIAAVKEGCYDLTMEDRIIRLESYCDAIEMALSLMPRGGNPVRGGDGAERPVHTDTPKAEPEPEGEEVELEDPEDEDSNLSQPHRIN
jgi:hypothetical protein